MEEKWVCGCSMARWFLRLVFSLFCLTLQNSVTADETVFIEINTSHGDMTLQLYPEAAPVTVANFLKYVDGKHFDNKATFYRTVRMDNQAQNNIKIEVIQGGLELESNNQHFAPILHETTQATGILHKDGVISMARLEPGSASSEFFICVNDQPALDFGGKRNPDGQGFAAFGRVIDGMDVVRTIQAMDTDMPEGETLEYTSGQMLSEPVVMHKVSRRD